MTWYHRYRTPLVAATLVALGFVGHLVAPPGAVRALLVAPAVLWVPGYSLLSRLTIRQSADRWAAPLAVLVSLVLTIVAALVVYAVFGHVNLATLPLWVSLGALPLGRPSRDPASGTPRLLVFCAAFCVVTVAVAGVVAGAHHVLPTQRQPGYLAFSFAGDYAGVPGVVDARPGSMLDIPVSVSGSEQQLAGLTVVVTVDGRPAVGTTATPLVPEGTGRLGARVEVTVQPSCLSRYSFTLDRSSTALRALDLYVTTDRMVSCHGD